MRSDWMRSALAGVLSALLLVQGHAGARPQASPAPQPSLTINVLAGRNATNSLRTKTAEPLVIEIRDANGRPIPAAVLHLSTPFDGPGVRFANGSRSITLVAETNGRVTVSDMTPEGLGAFQILIEASAAGEFANATITQANSENGAPPAGMARGETPARSGAGGKHLSRAAIIGIVAGVAVAAAAGLAVGLRNSGHSTNSSIGVGTPTVGAPK